MDGFPGFNIFQDQGRGAGANSQQEEQNYPFQTAGSAGAGLRAGGRRRGRERAALLVQESLHGFPGLRIEGELLLQDFFPHALFVVREKWFHDFIDSFDNTF